MAFLLMYQVYIIQSERHGRYYIGITSNIEQRLLYHNNKHLNNNSTINGIPWNLIFKLECQSKQQALKVEKHIKAMKSRTYIENLIKYKEMQDKLLSRFQDR